MTQTEQLAPPPVFVPAEIAVTPEVRTGIPIVERLDAEGFYRPEFTVPGAEGVSVIFRSREETPHFEDTAGITTAVISPDERPLRTSGDAFGAWLDATTNGAPLADPFERAAEDGSDVRLIANTTPTGVVSAAVKLIETGVVGDSEGRLGNLKDLKKKLSEGRVDDSVMQFIDELYAASSVSLASEGESSYREQGLMEVVMALTGDEAATETLAKKQAVQADMDEQQEQREVRQHGYEEGTKFKHPNEKLSQEELDLIASKHLVGVHTTYTHPHYVGGGDSGVSVIRPTSEFGDDRQKFPRNTMHWSLNHPVESHIFGSFGERPITIISPMEDTAKLNGAPAVLYGVDTYFAASPGEGMFIPESAMILETVDDPTAPMLQQVGNTLRLKDGDLTQGDLSQLTAKLGEMYHTGGDLGEYGAPPADKALYALVRDFTSHGGELSRYAHRIVSEKMWGRDERIVTDAVKAEWAKVDDLNVLLGKLVPEDVEFTGMDERARERFLEHALMDIFSTPGLIEQHPEVQKVFVEGLRKHITKLQIAKIGGKNVQSDGMSAYVMDEEFSKGVQEVCTTVGLRSGLHQYQSESAFEAAYGEALGAATTRLPAEFINNNSDVSYYDPADFDWTKYAEKGDRMWMALDRTYAPTRRMAISMGVVPYAKKAPVVNDDNDPWALGDNRRGLFGR